MGPQNNKETNPMQEAISPSNQVDETTQHQPELEGNQPPINQPPETTTNTRSTRVRTQPQHFRDYSVELPPSINDADQSSNQATSIVHPLANFVSYKNFSTNHKAFLLAIDS